MLVTHQNPYSFSSSLTNFLPTFPPLFFRPIILTRCLYCKSFFFWVKVSIANLASLLLFFYVDWSKMSIEKVKSKEGKDEKL